MIASRRGRTHAGLPPRSPERRRDFRCLAFRFSLPALSRVLMFAIRLTMLHIWLIPALVLLAVVLAGFYLVIRIQGGSGVRTNGRTVVDKPMDEDNLPPA